MLVIRLKNEKSKRFLVENPAGIFPFFDRVETGGGSVDMYIHV